MHLSGAPSPCIYSPTCPDKSGQYEEWTFSWGLLWCISVCKVTEPSGKQIYKLIDWFGTEKTYFSCEIKSLIFFLHAALHSCFSVPGLLVTPYYLFAFSSFLFHFKVVKRDMRHISSTTRCYHSLSVVIKDSNYTSATTNNCDNTEIEIFT